MGCLTAKASGSIASFISPTVTPIESARVYFSPTQLGEGTPSPENVREIVGRTSVELYHSGRNIAHIIGYSAINSDSNNTRKISNSYGTTINTIEFSLPDTKLVISQSQYPNTSTIHAYVNGYIGVLVDNLIWEQSYNVSFKVQDITSNPLNASLQNIKLLVPNGNSHQPEVNGDKLLFKNVVWKPHSVAVGRRNFEIRICGMSFTLSEFMVTPVEDENYDFKPYEGEIIPLSWKRLPDEYQEVEYIESDGGQYIDTGVVANLETSWDVDFSDFDNNGNSWAGVGGQYDSTRKSIINVGKNNTTVYCSFGNQYDKIHYTTNGWTTRLTFHIDKNGVKENGIVKGTFSDTITFDETNTLTITLFARNADGIFGRFVKMKLYSSVIKNNGTLVSNLIPCYRKSDDEIGMFDTVSQTFYTNQGTGTFTKGNDVFSDEVYGGYVDLVKGELIEEWQSVTYNGSESENWVATSIQRYYINLPNCAYVRTDNKNIFCNKLNSVSASSLGSSTSLVCYTNGANSIGVRIGTEIDTKDKLLEWLSENPITIVQKLTTPLTHQLTPTQLQTFKNENNIWSDADSVEIDYDLAETFDIQKAKRKIIMNQPHVESALNSPSSPQVIKFKTDMKAPLKQCIVNFAPIQEGSGDPSPTNIRPIKGWNGITLKHTGINMLQCSSPSYYIDATNNGITSQSSRNADNEVIGIDFSGTTTSTNIFRNLNYNPSDSGAVTMPQGLIGLTGYSDQVYVIPIGNSNAPRTTDGRYWTGANTNSENGWNIWSVDSSETYNGLWVRTQIFPKESNVNVDTTVYPMMCLAEDVGCEFEPYKGETFDVDWTDEIGTVYGGYVDLVSGKLVATHLAFVMDGTTHKVTQGGNINSNNNMARAHSFIGRTGIEDLPLGKNNKGIYAINKYIRHGMDNGAGDSAVEGVYCGTGTPYVRVVTSIDNLSDISSISTTVASINEWLSQNPIQICYELAEPITYQLTPQQLVTLKGQNNLWADTNGTIDVKYWKH